MEDTNTIQKRTPWETRSNNRRTLTGRLDYLLEREKQGSFNSYIRAEISALRWILDREEELREIERYEENHPLPPQNTP